ncbi:tetratricopeptide repeat protein [Streptomyces sp. NPDC049555]|uniref:tetratricopeptide repeat protein n=1 Tax=Streptomyces sp. NPDC049555 TaxID=3154930 RepID=UPI003423792B
MIEQNITVAAGYAHGVIGADLHVFGDGLPVYVLHNHRPAPEADGEWLAELPSRMLDARFAVVGFTGRADELRELTRWRESGPRLAVRWLHAPGGQGKTRLAHRFADASLAAGWKAVTATHGPGSVLTPGRSEDLRPDGFAGVLLVVDYADRWPQSHLTWLLSNALLHRPGLPARVLLLARTLDPWPPLRAALTGHQPHLSSQALAPLVEGSGQRREMFAVARAGFAARYGLADPGAAAPPPGPLEDAEYGLTLAVHIAALVAVDAHRAGRRPPRDVAGLTGYLLDREQLHWARLHGDGTHELDPAGRAFRTPPAVMHRAVFTAALTGAVGRPAGAAVLAAQGLDRPPPQRILADHAVCYPPADPGRDTVLEPLAPDRLAEDFLALAFPGHTADHPAQEWAPATASQLLGADGDDPPPAWVPRAVGFLAAAALRWPHLGPGYLFPVLVRTPELAVAAGSSALSDLAAVPDAGLDVLEAVASCFPELDVTDLAPGIAAVTRRLTACRLERTRDPLARALLWFGLGGRLLAAGLYQEAVEANEEAVRLYRDLAAARPLPPPPPRTGHVRRLAAVPALVLRRERLQQGIEDLQQHRDAAYVVVWLSFSLVNLGSSLAGLGRGEEALAAAQEAVGLVRTAQQDRLFASGAAAPLAGALAGLTNALLRLGRHQEALQPSQEAVQLYRALARSDPRRSGHRLAAVLSEHGILLGRLFRHEEALRVTQEAVRLLHRLSRKDPARHRPFLALQLNNLGRRRAAAGDFKRAARASEEAVALLRQLAQGNPAYFRPELARALANLNVHLAGDAHGGLRAAQEAVRLWRELARESPVHRAELGAALGTYGSRLNELGRHREALAAGEEAAGLLREAAGADPVAMGVELALALGLLAETKAGAAGDVAGALVALEEAEALARRAAAGNPAQGGALLEQIRQLRAWVVRPDQARR